MYRSFVQIPRFIKRENPNIVIEPAHFGPFNLPKSIKRVTVIHDLTPILFPSWHPVPSVLAHKLLMKRILSNADLIITNSEYTKSDIVSFSPQAQEKTRVIHLGVSGFFRHSQSRKQLQDLGVHKNFILYLGTIEPRKNLKNLIIAYNQLRNEEPEFSHQLILAGKEGWKTKEIMKERKNSPFADDIILLGYVDRDAIPSLLSHCSLFVYPSFYEGFGLPILEALACGARVLTSNTSSMPEVGGNHCIYCDPYDQEDIKNKMVEVLSQKDVTEEQNDRIAYAQSFTCEKFGETFYQHLKELHESDG